VEVNWRNLALGHEVFETSGATFVRNRLLPAIYDANFMFAITASEPAEVDALLTRAATEYAHAARLTFRVDQLTPTAFETRLTQEGYERREALVLLLDGPLRHEPRRFDIRQIEDESTWRMYSELKFLDWQEDAARTKGNPEDRTIAQGFASSSRLKCPPVQYVMAYEDGQAVGYCSGWEGVEGVGQVEDLFVHPAYRHRGIATALLHHSVRAARARGAGPVVIVVDPRNAAKDLYAALGWQAVAICRQYGKDVLST
jgi:ribosomal protein S18 acetylase RimI-like enzyme